MNAVARAQLTVQMLTLLKKYPSAGVERKTTNTRVVCISWIILHFFIDHTEVWIQVEDQAYEKRFCLCPLNKSEAYKHIEAETKWTPFSRRHFQVHFCEWKCMNFA